MTVGVVVWSVTLGAQTSPPPREDLTEYLPSGKGKALVAHQCSSCHDLKGTIQLRRAKPEWEAIVFDMVARGAPLDVEEADEIVAYLSEVFAPTSPPLVDVNTASKEALIKLPGITLEHADRLIAHRTANGPLSSRDQVRLVLGVDEQAFARIRWYVRASAVAP